MGKGKQSRKSLRERILELFNALGETDKPDNTEIRNRLSDFAISAEELENGEAIREAEAEIAALEATLEESNAQNTKIKGKLRAVQTEIDTFRAKQKKQEESKKDITPIQYKVLRELPSPRGGNGLPMEAIARNIGIPLDETDIVLDWLNDRQLIEAKVDQLGRTVWRRTKEGNIIAVAKRRAGEEDTEEQGQCSQPDLGKQEERVLVTLAIAGGGTAEEIAERLNKAMPMKTGKPYMALGMVRLFLAQLRTKHMVKLGREGNRWVVCLMGRDYLSKRRLP